ncbi:hypothetical protein Bca52824_032040 [Brassica carinata]|uniref:Uncharacterized protein n=1 Tax=Brassica carinata TaxID=52824 RepID=A0A8X7V5U3_BRACI|nr:hypothetical protein Bca52824_032040 [Brassica carinata]
MQDILMKFQKEIANSISNPCIRPHVEQPAHTEPVNTGTGSIPSGNTPPFVPDDIIQEAMRFANKESIDPSNATKEKDGDAEKGKCLEEDTPSGAPTSEDPQNMDPILNDVTEDVDPISVHMDTEEAHVNVEVRTGEDTETNRDIDGEDSAERVIAPPLNTTETSVDDSSTIAEANQETVATGLSFPDPSFSIGLTQLNKSNDEDADHAILPNSEEDSLPEADVDN